MSGVQLGCPYLSFFLPVYCNSLLAALNIRKAIRGTGHGDHGISLGPILDPHTSTTSKVIGLVVPPVPHRRSPIRWRRKSAPSPRLWGIFRTSKPEDTAGIPMPTITINVHRSSGQYPRTAPSKVNPTLSSPSPAAEKDEP